MSLWLPKSPDLVLGTVLGDAVELLAELVDAVVDTVHLGTELLVAFQVRVELLLVLLAGAIRGNGGVEAVPEGQGQALDGGFRCGGLPGVPPSPGPLILVSLVTRLHGRGVIGLILRLVQLGVAAAPAATTGGGFGGLLPCLLLRRAGAGPPVRLVTARDIGRSASSAVSPL